MAALETNWKQGAAWRDAWSARFEGVPHQAAAASVRADVVLEHGKGKRLALRFQASPCSPVEVERIRKWNAAAEVELVWVVHAPNADVLHAPDQTSIVDLVNVPLWLTSTGRIFVHDGSEWVYPCELTGGRRAYRTRRLSVSDFVAAITQGTVPFPTVQQATFTVFQRGAGNGKTYELIQSPDVSERQLYKNTHVFLTKMHSAKEVLLKELQDQERSGQLANLVSLQAEACPSERHAVFTCMNAQRSKRLIFGTIDSFLHACLLRYTSEEQTRLQFHEKAAWLADQPLEKLQNIQYAGQDLRLDVTLTLHVDEVQDLHGEYALFLFRLYLAKDLDVEVVGDKLQSIWRSRNALTLLRGAEYSADVRFAPPVNVCRRFSHPELRDAVNTIVPFAEFNLPPVELSSEKTDYSNPFQVSYLPDTDGKDVDQQTFEVEEVLRIVEEKMNALFAECRDPAGLHRTPEPNDFLFIHPTPGKHPLPSRLEEWLNHFWSEKLQCSGPKYAELHTSDEANKINLETSRDKSRIVSIHTAKGDGRRFVFTLMLSQHTFYCFTQGPLEKLQYESLLHVALTRAKRNQFVVLSARSDDVTARFEFLHPNGSRPPHLYNYCKITPSDLQSTLLERYERKKVDSLTSVPPSLAQAAQPLLNSSQVQGEWKHHVVRYAIMFVHWCRTVTQEIGPGNNQFSAKLAERTKLEISEPRRAVVLNYTQFRAALKNISEWNRTCWKGTEAAKAVARRSLARQPVPLVEYPRFPDVPKKVQHLLNSKILPLLDAQVNLFQAKLEPVECVLFMYAVNVLDEGLKYGKDPYPTLYNVYSIFEDVKGSEFYEAVETLQLAVNHYSRVYAPALGQGNRGVRCFKQNYCAPRSSELEATCSKPLVVFGPEEFHVHHLLPQYNDLNRVEKNAAVLANRYMLEYICEDQDLRTERGERKRIRSFVIVLHHATCFEVQVDPAPLHADWRLLRKHTEHLFEKVLKSLWSCVHYWQNRQEAADPSFQLLASMFPRNQQGAQQRANFAKTLLGGWLNVKWDKVRRLPEADFRDKLRALWTTAVARALTEWGCP
jgi:hypothetical protein